MRRWAAALTPQRAQGLADYLGLPVAALQFMPLLGWHDGRRAWTFPETDVHGRVTGAFFRCADGFRGVLAGSKRGLYLPICWESRPGPVRIVEGASDVLALAWLGLPVVGRSSAMCGADLLAELLRPLPAERGIHVLGDNDEKPDGRWPGKEGAEHVARLLRAALPGRHIVVCLPPPGYKDARDWVVRSRRSAG